MAEYKRRIYLVNPKFQLKFTFYICFFVFIASAIYPYMIYGIMESFIEFAQSHSPDAIENITEQRNSLIFVLVLCQLGFIGLTFVVSIFLTHRVAGPLFKLNKFFAAIRDGGDNGKLYFRKGDYFQDVADGYNEAVAKLREDYKNDFVYLSEVNSYINNLSMVVPDDKKAVIQEISKRLEQMQEKFNQRE